MSLFPVVKDEESLLGLDQWPGVSADYSVVMVGGAPTIRTLFRFDATDYSPDPVSTEPPTGPPVDPPAWQGRAVQALLVYVRLIEQFNPPVDPADNRAPVVTLALTTTLLPASNLTFDTADRAQLMDWLFGESGICAFLTARGGGDASWPIPTDQEIDIAFEIKDLNPGQIFELSTAFRLSRPAPVDATATTPIPPHVEKESDGSSSLAAFAGQLETCLDQETYAYKIAWAASGTPAMPSAKARLLWLVRLGRAVDQALSFRIARSTAPLIYALKPLYNTLQARPAVNYYGYTSGQGIDFTTPGGTHVISAVDVDGWLREFLAAVDAIFSPEFRTAMALVDQRTTASFERQLRDAWESLAASVSRLVIPFFADENPTEEQWAAARETLREQALVNLSSVYAVNAVVQFGATVTAGVQEPCGQEPPQLHGTFLPGQKSAAGTTLTPAKLPLLGTKTGATVPLTFLVTTTGTDPAGAVQKAIDLDLTYRGSQIELPGVEPDQSSSWLSFVLPPKSEAVDWPLDAHLGPFTVPLPLRSSPTPPTIVSQEAITHPLQQPADRPSVAHALQWDYSFTCAERLHYPHDRLNCATAFNVTNPALGASGRMESIADLVPDLFEFIAVYPDIQTDLIGKLDNITPDSTSDAVDQAAIVLRTFVQLVARTAHAVATFLPEPAAVAPRADLDDTVPSQDLYAYRIMESEVPKADSGNVSALLVSVGPKPPDGIGMPSVLIRGYDKVLYLPPEKGFAESCRYQETPATANAPAQYLTAAVGQALPERTVVLPGLNIFFAQSAETSGHIIRNQDLVPSRMTAAPFVLQSAAVPFSTPLRPLIELPDAIDLASFGSRTPIARTFSDHLDNLLTVLFAKAPPHLYPIRMAISYAVPLDPGLPDIESLVPISLLPQTKFQPKATAVSREPAFPGEFITHDELIAALRGVVYAWAEAHDQILGGRLLFHFTVMNSLLDGERPPGPLLVLEKLTLHLDDWSDRPV